MSEKILCAKCGKQMVLKQGKFGKFFSCTGYPDCKTSMPYPGQKRLPQGEEISYVRGWWKQQASTMVFFTGKEEVAKWIYEKDGNITKEGKVIDGKICTFHSNWSLKSDMTAVNNVLEGPFETYDENGAIAERGIYKNGKKQVLSADSDDTFAVDSEPSYDSFNDLEKSVPVASEVVKEEADDFDGVPKKDDEDLPF
ncbi:MAG: hypothetical protein CVV21_11155 [Candidatus Goldiibacteriota bacterium HGW-Goldbacteria-1]|jgi:ssDNA-binding Zn-finger/Zn-ribbon topoisomerase 1|nr:MAG: hypothetical protein CVV21_11155 [Candidatus Goldiibacteriota bacterium HGW-Goldbacteria-1]